MNKPQSTQRYLDAGKQRETQLTERILALASKYGRFAYRRFAALVNPES